MEEQPDDQFLTYFWNFDRLHNQPELDARLNTFTWKNILDPNTILKNRDYFSMTQKVNLHHIGAPQTFNSKLARGVLIPSFGTCSRSWKGAKELACPTLSTLY